MEVAGIYARESSMLGRSVQFGFASGRVINVSFPESVPEDADRDHPLLDRVDAYLNGATDDFDDVEVAMTLPTDRRQVLEAVRKVPHGERISIERLARLAGLDDEDETDLRLVEEALANNPIPLLIPDHRVEGPSGAPDEVARRLRALER